MLTSGADPTGDRRHRRAPLARSPCYNHPSPSPCCAPSIPVPTPTGSLRLTSGRHHGYVLFLETPLCWLFLSWSCTNSEALRMRRYLEAERCHHGGTRPRMWNNVTGCSIAIKGGDLCAGVRQLVSVVARQSCVALSRTCAISSALDGASPVSLDGLSGLCGNGP